MKRAEIEKLESLLRQQGLEETPAFSLPLHQRVMEALRVQGLPQPAVRAVAGRSWGIVAWKIGLPLAAVAAVAVVAWIVVHQGPSAVDNGTHMVNKVERVRSPLEIPEVKSPEIASANAIDDAKFAYLDRDARKLWMFVASQIPELPEEKKIDNAGMLSTERINTHSRSEIVDITPRVAEIVRASGIRGGLCVVYVPHTTAAVTINENADPEVKHDMLKKLTEMVPQEERYYRHGEGNSDSHVKTAMVGPSVTLIVEKGELVLGTWQGIYFCEFDGPRVRNYHVKVVGDRG